MEDQIGYRDTERDDIRLQHLNIARMQQMKQKKNIKPYLLLT